MRPIPMAAQILNLNPAFVVVLSRVPYIDAGQVLQCFDANERGCGGQTLEPPCGDCDNCWLAQADYYGCEVCGVSHYVVRLINNNQDDDAQKVLDWVDRLSKQE